MGLLAVAMTVLCATAAHADSTERVSVDPAGRELAAGAFDGVLSRDGRFTFFSAAPRPGLASGCDTFFVRDLDARRTECANLDVPPALGATLSVSSSSHDGRYVVVVATQDAEADRALLLWDREAGVVDRIDRPEDGLPSPRQAAVSADGRFVVFVVDRAGRHPGQPRCRPAEPCDVLLRDRLLRTTELVNVTRDGSASAGSALGPSLSDDGRYVAFTSDADDLLPGIVRSCFQTIVLVCVHDLYLRDRRTGTTTLVRDEPGGRPSGAFGVVHASGRFVDYVWAPRGLIPFSAGGQGRVFRYDVRRRSARQLYKLPQGAAVYLPLSDDARWIAFEAFHRVPPVVVDGREVEIETPALFVHDRLRRSTRQIDVAPDGGLPRDPSGLPISIGNAILGVSASGRTIVFASDAANLVAVDDNDVDDVFVRRLDP